MKFNLIKIISLAFASLCLLGSGSGQLSFEPSDLFKDLQDIAQGFGSEAGNLIPTPAELFDTSIQALFGLPELAVYRVISELCAVYAASDKIEPRVTPNIEEMYFQLRTPCANISVPLAQAEQLLAKPEFDQNKKVVVFVTGWKTNLNDTNIEQMAQAFHCRGGYNFLALNTSDFIRTLYTWSAFNTEEIGRIFAEGLVKLSAQIPVDNFYLIGHSLGAQIVGAAGRHFTKLTTQTLARITGLDPANPCFNQGEALTGLYRGDAEFVDVIHTNPGVNGKRDPLGDVDFYPNGFHPIKPGCVQFGCSHGRAVEFFIESIYPENENDFLAKRCTSLVHLNASFCNGPEYPMGYAAPNFLKGDYFLSVNGKQPYGQNATDNAVIVPHQCGKCQSNSQSSKVKQSSYLLGKTLRKNSIFFGDAE